MPRTAVALALSSHPGPSVAVSAVATVLGIAVGLDRVLMLLLGAQEIAEVLLFPARDFV